MMSVAFSIDMVMLTALAFSLHAFKHGVVHPLELFLVSFCRLLDALLLKLLLLDLLFELLRILARELAINLWSLPLIAGRWLSLWLLIHVLGSCVHVVPSAVLLDGMLVATGHSAFISVSWLVPASLICFHIC